MEKFNTEVMGQLDVCMMDFVHAVEECGGAPAEYNAESMKEFREEYRRRQASMPHCPTCNSTNIRKISASRKVAGAMGFGLLSNTARSQFECLNCKYKW